VAERLDALTQWAVRIHRRAHRGAGAIGADQHAHRKIAFHSRRVGHPDALRIEVGADQRLSEMKLHAGGLGGFQQQHVQRAARNRPDHFAVVDTVALQGTVAVEIVHHAPAHHHGALQHVVGKTRRAQRLQAPLGEGQVDRPSADETGPPGIRTFLDHLDRKAALRQLLCQQRTDQAAANEGDGLLRHAAIRGGNPPTVPQAVRNCNPGQSITCCRSVAVWAVRAWRRRIRQGCRGFRQQQEGPTLVGRPFLFTHLPMAYWQVTPTALNAATTSLRE